MAENNRDFNREPLFGAERGCFSFLEMFLCNDVAKVITGFIDFEIEHKLAVAIYRALRVTNSVVDTTYMAIDDDDGVVIASDPGNQLNLTVNKFYLQSTNDYRVPTCMTRLIFDPDNALTCESSFIAINQKRYFDVPPDEISYLVAHTIVQWYDTNEWLLPTTCYFNYGKFELPRRTISEKEARKLLLGIEV